MAFFKSFFGNSADMQDKSFTLESLERSSPTTDSTRAGSMLMVANPTSMNADTTPAPTVLPDTTPMDANTTLAPAVSPDTTLMDTDTTLTPVLSADAPLAATPTNAILINADTTPIPAISTDTTLMVTNTTPMDADTTPTPDNNTPGSYPVLSLPKEMTPGGVTGGGESTMVIYKRSSVAKNSLAVLPPSKVHLREVDHSSTLHTQVYGLNKSLYHKNADFNKENIIRKMPNLEAQIRGKDAIIAEQAQLLSQLSQGLKEVKQQTAAQSLALAQVGLKDAIIVQQSDTLQRLQRDLNEVQNHAVVEAKVEIQRLQVDRELEILALNQKYMYEMTLCKLEELQSCPPMVSDLALEALVVLKHRFRVSKSTLARWGFVKVQMPISKFLNAMAPTSRLKSSLNPTGIAWEVLDDELLQEYLDDPPTMKMAKFDEQQQCQCAAMQATIQEEEHQQAEEVWKVKEAEECQKAKEHRKAKEAAQRKAAKERKLHELEVEKRCLEEEMHWAQQGESSMSQHVVSVGGRPAEQAKACSACIKAGEPYLDDMPDVKVVSKPHPPCVQAPHQDPLAEVLDCQLGEIVDAIQRNTAAVESMSKEVKDLSRVLEESFEVLKTATTSLVNQAMNDDNI
ncbi:hypothetical protein EDD16DRAFT_1707184 [Pisolithus croceorrhizus]|nr:hypothetical protein EV401DRAFT_2075630 [Pisolithus croceorrhizus]KAI6118685.1 hypothetical protein EDD16DRAFT_1707184 [Pisolithus croceorrhizus]KAI6167178.1 hypothetical protein EDD17DRAFT_1752568 [Pisolithus thermaeus]